MAVRDLVRQPRRVLAPFGADGRGWSGRVHPFAWYRARNRDAAIELAYRGGQVSLLPLSRICGKSARVFWDPVHGELFTMYWRPGRAGFRYQLKVSPLSAACVIRWLGFPDDLSLSSVT